MDPIQCLRTLLDAIWHGDAEQAASSSAELGDWFSNDGSVPDKATLRLICMPYCADTNRGYRDVSTVVDVALADPDASFGQPRAPVAVDRVVTPPQAPQPSGWPFKPAPRPPGAVVIPHNPPEHWPRTPYIHKGIMTRDQHHAKIAAGDISPRVVEHIVRGGERVYVAWTPTWEGPARPDYLAAFADLNEKCRAETGSA